MIGRTAAAPFVVAVQCGQAGGTCFCVSMNTGPVATRGFDLALTDVNLFEFKTPLGRADRRHSSKRHRAVRTGSTRGESRGGARRRVRREEVHTHGDEVLAAALRAAGAR
jgi:hypothetical protein